MNLRLFKLIHTDTLYNEYYYQPLAGKMNPSLLWKAFFELKLYVFLILHALYLPFNKDYNNQQFEGVRKSKLTMVWENLIWTLKFKEVCTYYFLYGLDIKGSNPNDYMPYTEFRLMRNIVNIRQRERLQTGASFNYLALVHDKFLFYQICKSLGMPFPKTIALVSKGQVSWYNGKNMTWSPFDSITNGGGNFTAFCKDVTGEGGKGAFVLEVSDGTIKVNGIVATLEDLKGRFGSSTYILQEKISNHSIIKNLYPQALNTLRLHTILNDDGTVEFYSAVHRFGSNGSIVDNGCQGGMLVGVNKDGVMNMTGCYEPQAKFKNLIVGGKHPNTNVEFAGMKLPYWDEILGTTKRFHQFFYGIPSMGWDIAITEDGFCYTEAGDDWEIAFDQCANGPGREKFYKYHGYALNIPLRKI